MKTRVAVLLLIAFLSTTTAHADHPAGVFGGGGAGPINTIPAPTLSAGQWVGAVRLDYLDANRFSDEQLLEFGEQDIHADSINYSLATFMNLAYGVSDDFTLSVRLPHFYQDTIREPEHNDDEIEVADEGKSSGLGDILFMGVIRLFGTEESPTQFSAIVGLEIPSGRDSDLTREAKFLSWNISQDPALGTGSLALWRSMVVPRK